MARRSFSPLEVQGLVPVLEQIFGHFTILSLEIGQAQARLRTLEAEAQVEMLHLINEKTLEQDELLAKVEAMGAEVKDPAQGLIDFPWRREGSWVCLCWRFGEKRVGWWHTEDEGFQGRKPIEATPRHEESLLN